MVRVGGGWVALDEFLVKNDPCRGELSILKAISFRHLNNFNEVQRRKELKDAKRNILTRLKPKTTSRRKMVI